MPPVITGQSLVTDTIYKILVAQNSDIYLIELDIVANSLMSKSLNYLYFVFKFIFSVFSSPKVVYFPAARSLPGFLRNTFIILISKIFGHKLVIHFHCGEYNKFVANFGRAFFLFSKWLFKKIDVYIILGESLYKNYDLILDSSKTLCIIPNGIEVLNTHNRILFKNNSISLIFLSNLIESKGYLDVLYAVETLVNDLKLTNVKCYFCGNFLKSSDDSLFKNIDDAKNYFFEYIENHNLTNNVFYLGLVNGEQKSKLLEKSDIFILPTNYATEAQPLSILEAMSYGNIVISCAHRAIPDMVINEFNGILVPYNSHSAISDSVVRLLNDVELQNKLSRNAISYVSKKYSMNKFEMNIINLFKKLEVIV